MNKALRSQLESILHESGRTTSPVQGCVSVGGGCIDKATRVQCADQDFFVKQASAEHLARFESEARSLEVLRATGTLRVPEPIHCGHVEETAYLVMEALDLTRGRDAQPEWRQMGCGLAQIHRETNEQFGFEADNWIGGTPQINAWQTDWADFFRDYRLRPQFGLARRNGLPLHRTEALLAHVPHLLGSHCPQPSLLHGDLWSGNVGFTRDGQATLYDPACYYGDRETDLAFSRYFGGFPSAFYDAYQREWPLPPGHEDRQLLYNLYHVTNHANLFGGGYTRDAQSHIDQLLAAT